MELIKYLASKTQNLNYQNKRRETALHCAADNFEAFMYLMSFGNNINPNLTNISNQLPLHFVCTSQSALLKQENRIEMVKALIPVTLDTDQTDSFNNSPLDYAKDKGFIEIVKMLSEKSINNFKNKVRNFPNCPDYNGRLPIHQVCIQNNLSFELNIKERVEYVEKLINLTSNIDQQDTFGYTALHYAARERFCEIVKILTKKCNTNVETENGYLPIELAIIHNDVESVKILAPLTKPFQFSGILQKPEVQAYFQECLEIFYQYRRKRKANDNVE